MNKTRRLIGGLVGVIIGSAGLSACGGDDDTSSVASDCEPKYEFTSLEEGKLIVASPQYPPAFSQDGNQDPVGIDADILAQFAEDSCLEPDWQIIPQSGAIESVKGGRTDIAAGNWYATPERAEIVGQTDPVFVDRPTWASTTGDATIDAFEGQTVGTITGYLWVEEMKAVFGEDLKLYDSPDATVADLKAGRIDAALVGSVEIAYILSQSPDESIKTAPMEPDPAIASSVDPYLPNYPHTKDNTELTDALNAALADYRESGVIAKALEDAGVDPSLADVSEYVD